MPVYVILAPESIRGICATWEECQAKIFGVSSAKFQKVPHEQAARAMLSGETDRLSAGTFAFTDGNHRGGIGIVFVHRAPDGKTARREVSTTLAEVFPEGITLADGGAVSPADMLARIRNIATELAAAYVAVSTVKPNTRLTIVYDYEGVGAWLREEDPWKIKDPIVASLIQRIKTRARDAGLSLGFRHLRGHQADRLLLSEWIQENRRADALATQAVP